MNVQMIDLIKGLPIENGGHIVYVFNEKLSYIENLIAYIMDGVKLGHRVLIIDEADLYLQVRKQLDDQLSEKELQFVFFENNTIFYGIYADFQSGIILEHFAELLHSLPHGDRVIRTWARVVWKDQEDIFIKLENHENRSDDCVHGQGIISLCAYDGTQIPAELMIKLLRHHDYFMTDKELIRSPLYVTSKKKVIFPSLSIQSKINSEIDFYKRKLDFVHVVSHEVRNPLTVIRGYANILRNTERNLSSDGLRKVVAIEQHVKVIDQELTHIIETEQMLSSELYMKLEPIDPYSTLQNIIEIMTVRAAIENVSFECNIDLHEGYLIMGNQMGLRLILSNLISNAIKYTGEQGNVEFSTQVEDNRLRFLIEDNGLGMSDSQLKSLFKKYGKFDESKSGQGIGLYIVKNLIVRFNGTIHFDSSLGRGTKVGVEFPLIDSTRSS